MNWKKLRNKGYILKLLAAALIALQLILAPLGYKIDNEYISITANAILSILVILGIVQDHNIEQ